MIVSTAELQELQGVTQKRIQELERQPSDDFSAKFILQTLDSNITLILNSARKDASVVELGTRDGIVSEALMNYRAEIAQKHSELAFAGEIAFYASQAMNLLESIKKSVPEKEVNLYNNLAAKISLVEPHLKDMASFFTSDKVLSKLRKKDVSQEINPDYKSVVPQVQEKAAAKKTSASKAGAKSDVKSEAKPSARSSAKPAAKNEAAATVKSAAKTAPKAETKKAAARKGKK